jgi:type IV secretion system protein VirB9
MRPVFAALLVLAAVPATAEDGRIVTRFYDPAKIVTLATHAGIQSTVQFGDDERIENVALGDSADWQVTPNKRASLLFVKPMSAPARTNMTVVTDRRTYLFDLTAGARNAPVYMMRFTYPKPATAPVLASAKPDEAAIAAAVAKAEADQVAAQPTPADLNFAWTTAGDRKLLPERLFDDGHATWLAWPKEVALPAILVREANGSEGPVNYTTRGDYIVVDGVLGQLVLRQGKQMATLTPDPHAARAAAAPTPLPTSAGAPADATHPGALAHAADGRP